MGRLDLVVTQGVLRKPPERRISRGGNLLQHGHCLGRLHVGQRNQRPSAGYEWAGLRGGHTRYLEIRRSEERVHLHGDVAVITGVADMRASIDGTERQLRNRYTNVWAKSDEGWRMIAWQSTAVPKAG